MIDKKNKISQLNGLLNLQQTKLRPFIIVLALDPTTFPPEGQAEKTEEGLDSERESLSLKIGASVPDIAFLSEHIRSPGDYAVTCPLGEC